MAASGTYAFNPALADIVLDAFERVDIRPSALTPDHMISARRSLNFVLSKWSNRVPNQWLTDEYIVPMIDGQQNYVLPAGTVTTMDIFSRSYQLGSSTSQTVNFSTVNGSPTVTLEWDNHGLVTDQWINVGVPVAIGGLVIFGFYQVTSVPSTNTLTVTAASNATGLASGGTVPSYASVAADATITVTLAAHGYLPGQSWTVNVQLSLGGLALLGQYTITAVTTNTLTFEASSPAGSTDTQSENSGKTLFAAADLNAGPQDIIMTPMGRTEWAMIPNKSQTSFRPMNYWFERLITPVLHFWPIPNLTAPTELHVFLMRQIQDANPQNTETPDIPYRFEEAFCSDLAAHLAIKWKLERLVQLQALAKDAWAEAAQEDRERVTLNVQPQLSGYFR